MNNNTQVVNDGISYDEEFFGTWINYTEEANETPSRLFSQYTFYPNGTCLTPYGLEYWRIVNIEKQDGYHKYLNIDCFNPEIYALFNTSFFHIYSSFSFSNNNEKLILDLGYEYKEYAKI